MTAADRTTATQRAPMDSLGRTALVAGVLYLVTIASIPTLGLYGAVRNDPSYVTGPGPDTPVVVGGLLEMIVALACVGTAVALFPVVKRQNEGVALGFVGARVPEAAAIVAGAVSLLSVVTLRQAGAGADAVVTGRALVALYNWLLHLGQRFMPVVHVLLPGSLLYRSRLVPRSIPLLGLIGAPLLLASDLAVLFGLWGQASGLAGVAALPIALWEFSPGVWLVVKGCTPSPITAGTAAPSPTHEVAKHLEEAGSQAGAALLGGAFGELIGLRSTAVVAGLGVAVALGWLLLSPVRSLRTLPAGAEEPASRQPVVGHL